VISENDKFPKKTEGDGKPDKSSGFEVLIRRIGEGSDEAVWELLNRYSANILRVVRRHLPAELRPKVDSVDIVQSVWKSLLRKGEGFDHIASAEQFIGYISRVAQYKVFEAHRHFTKYAQFDIRREAPMGRPKHSGEEVGDELGDCIDPRSHDPGEVLHALESWSLAMEKAGERGQRVVQLRLRGMTYQEIAEETGLSAITVRRTLASVLTSLTA
jgi:RNA polymerase sigma factor (sigma-70 family)